MKSLHVMLIGIFIAGLSGCATSALPEQAADGPAQTTAVRQPASVAFAAGDRVLGSCDFRHHLGTITAISPEGIYSIHYDQASLNEIADCVNLDVSGLAPYDKVSTFNKRVAGGRYGDLRPLHLGQRVEAQLGAREQRAVITDLTGSGFAKLKIIGRDWQDMDGSGGYIGVDALRPADDMGNGMLTFQ